MQQFKSVILLTGALLRSLTVRAQIASAGASPAHAPASDPTLDAYRASSDCDGEEWKGEEAMLDADRIIAKAGLWGHKRGALTNAQAEAAHENVVAQAALDKGCYAIARQLFLGVIDTYVGSAYMAARQRAQIGLDDLRAVSTHTIESKMKPAPAK